MTRPDSLKATILNVRVSQAVPRFYEITFLDPDTGEPEPLVLAVHHVELKKLVRDLQELVDGRTDHVGAEGVYVGKEPLSRG